MAQRESTIPTTEPSKVATAKKALQPKDPETLMAADPNLRALYLKSFRAGLARRFGSMYQTLALSPAQIDKFEQLATAQADDTVTIHAGALAQGLTLSDPGVAALEKQNISQFYEQVGNEVGAPVVQELIELDRLSPMQHVANITEAFISAGTSPLTGEQEAQLTKILANASPSYQAGGQAEANSIDWDSVYDRADSLMAGILTGAQLQAFKVAVEFQQASARRNRFEAEQRAGNH